MDSKNIYLNNQINKYKSLNLIIWDSINDSLFLFDCSSIEITTENNEIANQFDNAIKIMKSKRKVGNLLPTLT